jgi:hypothetical protein
MASGTLENCGLPLWKMNESFLSESLVHIDV